jgi:hypothetical protein
MDEDISRWRREHAERVSTRSRYFKQVFLPLSRDVFGGKVLDRLGQRVLLYVIQEDRLEAIVDRYRINAWADLLGVQSVDAPPATGVLVWPTITFSQQLLT